MVEEKLVNFTDFFEVFEMNLVHRLMNEGTEEGKKEHSLKTRSKNQIDLYSQKQVTLWKFNLLQTNFTTISFQDSFIAVLFDFLINSLARTDFNMNNQLMIRQLINTDFEIDGNP